MMTPVELPGIYGWEHERRLTRLPENEHISDPAILGRIVAAEVNAICSDGGTVPGGFSMHNGGKHYVDSCRPDESFETLGLNAAYETATPETTSVRELQRYARAQDRAAIVAIQEYLGGCAEATGITYNHRASLGRENTYGAQLNYGISHRTAQEWGYFGSGYGLAHFAQSVVAAGFITGAGALGSNRLLFSQKANGLVGVQGRWSNRGTIFQLPSKNGERGTLQRVELRLADAHPKEWGNYAQAGLGGIALAVAQVPELVLQKRFGMPLTDRSLLKHAKVWNEARVDGEGILCVSPVLGQGIDWTARIADTFLELPPQGIKGEADLRLAAEEILTYCDAFREVVAKRLSIHTLAEKGATWAHRAAHILGKVATHDKIVKFSRPDYKAVDSAYDLVRVKPDSVEYGPAFELGPLPEVWRLTEEEIVRAMMEPPADTIAAYRIRMLKQHRANIYDINWSRIHVWTSEDRLATIYTNDPLAREGRTVL